MLHAPPGHCLLDTRQAADEQFAALFFRPRAGKINTYFGAFLDCRSLTALRNKQSAFALSFGYYLAPTIGASNPVAQPRDQYLRALCQSIRASHGSLDFATAAEAAKREIETQMQTLPIGPPRFGPVVAEDANGCYQIILNKRRILSFEHREASLTIVTLVKRRPLMYTRTTTYLNAGFEFFVKQAQLDVSAIVRSNP